MTVEYVNVFSGQDQMARMLEYSHGERKVPVIVDDDQVTVGYQGGT